MSSLIKSATFSNLCLKNKAILFTVVRNHWNKDYKPGPCPKTPEEFATAAEKYNLLPSEYKPYPDDGTGFGDYPALPNISHDSKDPFYPWDNPELKRNFNEPLHKDFDLMREDRYDVSYKLRYPLWNLVLQFLGVMLGAVGIFLVAEKVKMFPALVPKQVPGKGKVHYTFEQNE